MINKETIISVFNEKLTLFQWLKTINKALDDAVLTNVEITKKGNATFVFLFTFEDGTQVESNEIIVNQGESIVGATIQNGHLLLTLSNDDVLDAGNVKPVSSFSFNSARHLIVTYGDGTTQDLGLIKGVSGFSINASQHLIVTYDDGTTEDLGSIFSGNVNINGNFTANSIIENMSGYILRSTSLKDDNNRYISVVKTGNKITFVLTGTITISDAVTKELANFEIPSSIGNKLYPNIDDNRILLNDVIITNGRVNQRYTLGLFMTKWNNTSISFYATKLSYPPVQYVNGEYIIRAEITFLLSNNMEVTPS